MSNCLQHIEQMSGQIIRDKILAFEDINLSESRLTIVPNYIHHNKATQW